MADVSSAIAAAVALAMGGGDRGGLLGGGTSSNPTTGKTSSSTSAAQPSSLPPETTLQAATAAAATKLTSQGQDNSGLGRFYVIRACEEQPAPAAGHFVKVVSGPHNGYEAAVASAKDPRSHRGNGNDSGGNGSSGGGSGRGLPAVETSVKEQLSRLLQQPPGGGALSGLPVQLEEGVRNNRMDPAALQRLLNPSQEQLKSSSPKDEEQIFLPLDTPVWHLPSGTGDGSLMVTRAENVEWMRMIWGKMDDPSAIVEMLSKQQKEKEEEEKSEADRARRQQEEQEHQRSDQQRLLTQVMSSMGSAAGAAARQQQRNHQQSAAPTPSTQDLLAQLLGGHDFSAVQKELEVSLGKQNVTDSFAPPGPRHARKTSLESMSMFESMGSLMSPQTTSMSGGAAPSLLNLFDQPLPAAAPSPVRAALTPGTLAPGAGPFYVVMADSRIQLTANGFNLSVASGPHGGFEEALASMATVSHRRSMPRKDVQMVHVTSDTPIWHSLDLAHTSQPTMIVKACSLQGAPFKLEDDAASLMPPPPSPGMGSLQQHLSLLGALTQSPRQSPVTLAPLPGASSGPPEFTITSQPVYHPSSKMPPPPAHILEMTTTCLHNPEPVHKAHEEQQGHGASTFGEPSDGSLKRPLERSNAQVPNKKAHILGRQGSASPPPEEAEEQPEALRVEEGNQEAEPDKGAPDDGVEKGDKGRGDEDSAANEHAHGHDVAAEEAGDGA